MFLSNGDLLAIIIALAGSCFVMVKSLKENMKLQRQINELKRASKK